MDEKNFNVYFSFKDHYFRAGVIDLIKKIFASLDINSECNVTINIVDDVLMSDLAIILRKQGDSFLKCSISDYVHSHPEKDLNILVVPDYGHRPNTCVLSLGDMLPAQAELWMIESLLKTNITYYRTILSEDIRIPLHTCKTCTRLTLTEKEKEIICLEATGGAYPLRIEHNGMSIKTVSAERCNAIKKLKLLNFIDYAYFLSKHKEAICDLVKDSPCDDENIMINHKTRSP